MKFFTTVIIGTLLGANSQARESFNLVFNDAVDCQESVYQKAIDGLNAAAIDHCRGPLEEPMRISPIEFTEEAHSRPDLFECAKSRVSAQATFECLRMPW